ncbi:hypothetical protein MNEG_8454 [Monoraphidium neglectum]|jgi:hypothetical protein|uniref:Uncharacterized protein n=1 Tax=Monoraphidium neglectum TaxID=145388 RepID=A0A0D2MZF1_9CHLO|nr:hypothetical protein MNEG_8454 [Monoraphidium neglectum]KIY99510.1 hypothetical protein MNEG_8454 [Monoraphidium neglectum]|eukprot:XP_013898530.1 hypothetical protein MNEG_8454 [Monoraphidium neglectum]
MAAPLVALGTEATEPCGTMAAQLWPRPFGPAAGTHMLAASSPLLDQPALDAQLLIARAAAAGPGGSVAAACPGGAIVAPPPLKLLPPEEQKGDPGGAVQGSVV